MRLIMFGISSPNTMRQDEVAVLQGQRLPAQNPRLERPEDEREHEHHRPHPAVAQVRGDDDEQRDRRNHEKHVRQEVDNLVDDPAHVGGGDAERRGDDGREDAGRDAEEQRPAGAHDDLREDVAALVGRPEQMVPRRRLACGEDVEIVWVLDGDQRRDQCDEHHEADHRESGARLGVAQQEDEPAGNTQPPRDPPRRRREREVEGRVELRHQLVRSRGSRTRFRMSMNRFARITQMDSTTRSDCASG
jgi:hypothetical protein